VLHQLGNELREWSNAPMFERTCANGTDYGE
jgi:hypothetical protein